jgi:uncharacterized protein
MQIELTGKIKKNPIIIDGFPGIGLVATIATEFLIEHLGAKEVGTIKGKEVPPLVAIHDKKIVKPMGLFYDEKHNILILHVISGSGGLEGELSELLLQKASELEAKEIISLESVSVPGDQEVPQAVRSFYYANRDVNAKKLQKVGCTQLSEGIIMGVTGALMQRTNNGMPLSCVFAETHTGLPDSKAAAKIIEVLDAYLGLDVDIKPLLESAEKFELKIKTILEKGKAATTESDRRKMSYVG